MSYLTKYDGKITHNMKALMLDARFKRLISISNSIIGHELGMALATKVDKKSLYSILLLKSYQHLHPLSKIESSFVIKFNEEIVWISLKW
jgi:hypothetical protein